MAIKPNCVSASSLLYNLGDKACEIGTGWNSFYDVYYELGWISRSWTFHFGVMTFWSKGSLYHQHLSANTPILINISTVMFNISVNTRKVHFGWIQQSAAVLPNIKCWQFGFNSNPAPCNEDLGRTQYKMLPLRRFFSIFADADGDFVLFLWSLLVLQIGKLSS